ncbi:MAG TPA: hypothetical protein VGE24_13000, partial [Emticicia sp.]
MANDYLETIVKPKKKSSGKVDDNKERDDDSLDLKELLKVLSQVKNGKLNVRIPITQAGISGKI